MRTALPSAPRSPRRPLAARLRRVLGDPVSLLGLALVGGLVLAALFAPWLAPYPPLQKHFDATLHPPSARFWFGTDQYGQDVFSRVLYAARLDLFIAATAVAGAMSVGVSLGAVAGYLGGWWDEIIMRLLDVLQAFPALILALGIAYALGPGVGTVIAATAFVNIPGYARLMRGSVLTQKERTYASAALALGASDTRILLRHVAPNSLSPCIVNATLHFGWAILEAAGLSFLGLGVAVPEAEWGVMISMGLQDFYNGTWWTYTFPGLFIILAVLGFNLLGDALQDALDPKRRP